MTMKRLFPLVTAALMVCIVSATGLVALGKEKATMNADVEAIHKLTRDWTEAYNRGDLEELVAGFARDGKLLEDQIPMIVGHAALRDFWRGNLEDAEGSILNLEPIETRVSSDSGFAYSLGRVTVSIPGENGSTSVIKGKYLDILKKEDGRWFWAIGVGNYDSPN